MKFDFDDLVLVPAPVSDIKSRNDVEIFDENKMLPLFSAPMDTVVNDTNKDIFIDNKIYTISNRTEGKIYSKDKDDNQSSLHYKEFTTYSENKSSEDLIISYLRPSRNQDENISHNSVKISFKTNHYAKGKIILKRDGMKTISRDLDYNLNHEEIFLGLSSLKNYNSAALPLKIQLNIKRSICRIEIVKWNSKMDMRYELFNRLNTGGSILTEQEIRNCIFRGVSNKFNSFLERMAAKDDFIELIRPTDRQREQKYLEELVLRFTSLVNNNWEKSDNWKNTADKLSTYMTHFMKNATEDESFDFDSLANLFETHIPHILI